jgi:dihydroflavonol-4-reductase
MSERTVLVTGISGFIAKHCALELLRAGYRVRGTVRSRDKGEQVRATLARHADVGHLDFCEADLLADEGWAAAMRGVDGVLHLASPFPLKEPRHPDELLKPAIEGTLRVLKAAAEVGVPRLVQTSSMASVLYGHPQDRTAPFTEEDWTDADAPRVSSYARSKTLAERAARDFVARHAPGLHYASVNPGFVQGPLLDGVYGSSAEAILMFLRGKYPGCPKLSFPVVDVRDVARMHRLALETSEPSGGRYLAVAGTAWFVDMMRPIKAELGAAARKVPGFELPSFLVRLIALVDADARAIAPDLEHRFVVDNSRTRKALEMDFIPVEQSAPAMARSLVELGLV